MRRALSGFHGRPRQHATVRWTVPSYHWLQRGCRACSARARPAWTARPSPVLHAAGLGPPPPWTGLSRCVAGSACRCVKVAGGGSRPRGAVRRLLLLLLSRTGGPVRAVVRDCATLSRSHDAYRGADTCPRVCACGVVVSGPVPASTELHVRRWHPRLCGVPHTWGRARATAPAPRPCTDTGVHGCAQPYSVAVGGAVPRATKQAHHCDRTAGQR